MVDASQQRRSKRLLFFVSEDWYFCSHRLPLAIAAQKAGYSVSVITNVNKHGKKIEDAGLQLIPVRLSRSSKNPLTEARLIYAICRHYRSARPDIVHHVAVKPVIYGSIAAKFAGVQAKVNAIAGLGSIFVSSKRSARLLRSLISRLYRYLLNQPGTRVILQNNDDARLLCDAGVLGAERVSLIQGSGVDPYMYAYVPEAKANETTVVLASRMLWDKGVGEFVAAAEILKSEGLSVRFVLVGEADEANPSSISEMQLCAWRDAGIVEWWGRRSDMPSVFAASHIVCLPSYREGLPKVLIEAASCGRPIVTTDAPGCREIVRDGDNGFLVPVNQVEPLAAALRTLIGDPELRFRMGQCGRQRVLERFTLEQVVRETLAVYDSVMQ
tara:strand:- start:5312 stop:6463 length:1152 start_codon:yes stop_codon:yes gene_type:complete